MELELSKSFQRIVRILLLITAFQKIIEVFFGLFSLAPVLILICLSILLFLVFKKGGANYFYGILILSLSLIFSISTKGLFSLKAFLPFALATVILLALNIIKNKTGRIQNFTLLIMSISILIDLIIEFSPLGNLIVEKMSSVSRNANFEGVIYIRRFFSKFFSHRAVGIFRDPLAFSVCGAIWIALSNYKYHSKIIFLIALFFLTESRVAILMFLVLEFLKMIKLTTLKWSYFIILSAWIVVKILADYLVSSFPILSSDLHFIGLSFTHLSWTVLAGLGPVWLNPALDVENGVIHILSGIGLLFIPWLLTILNCSKQVNVFFFRMIVALLILLPFHYYILNSTIILFAFLRSIEYENSRKLSRYT